MGTPELTNQIWGQPQLALVSTDCRIQNSGHTGKKATSHRVASILGCQKKKIVVLTSKALPRGHKKGIRALGGPRLWAILMVTHDSHLLLPLLDSEKEDNTEEAEIESKGEGHV